MNAEYLQDALNFLDDDLIEETDALRRGERVIRCKPKIIQWVVPAACLALAIGAASALPVSMESGKSDSAIVDHTENMAPGNANGMPEYSLEQGGTSGTWQVVTCGNITLSIPADWEYELVTGTDDTRYIRCGTAGEMALQVGFDPTFAVCGTGLEEQEITIAGMPVRAGYYDGASRWSFAVYRDAYIFLNEGSEAWWNIHEETANAVLDTVTINEEGS